MVMTETELIAWLQLAAVPSLGGSRIQRLLTYATPSQLVTMTTEQLQQCGLTTKQIQAFLHPNPSRLQLALQWQQVPHQHILTLDSPHYPHLLKQISSPPPTLFVRAGLV